MLVCSSDQKSVALRIALKETLSKYILSLYDRRSLKTCVYFIVCYMKITHDSLFKSEVDFRSYISKLLMIL